MTEQSLQQMSASAELLVVQNVPSCWVGVIVKCPWMCRLTVVVVRRFAYSVTINWRSLASNASFKAFSSTSSWCWQQSTYSEDFNWDGCIHERLTGVMGSAFWLVFLLRLVRREAIGFTSLPRGEVTFLVMRRSFWLNFELNNWDTIFELLKFVGLQESKRMDVFSLTEARRANGWLVAGTATFLY